MNEVWKPIEGYEGSYEVSNLGRVRSLDRVIKRRFYRGMFLKLNPDKNGYFKVTLHLGDGRKTYKVHRLVAKAFVPNLSNKAQVNHLDENKQNNQFENLEWVTSAENTRYGTGIERMKKSMPKKAIIGTSLKDGTVMFFESTAEARRSGFQNVQHVLGGRHLQCKGYTWEYVS